MARDIPRVMKHADAVRYFEEEMMPGIRAIEAASCGHRDMSRRREAWNNWTDALCKNKQISDWQYNNWTHPPSCEW